MSLTLHFHPLSSFCHKALIALYENGTPFSPCIVDLMKEESRAAFLRLWPIGRFPVLRDDARDATVPESSIIIEYLDQHYPGGTRFFPADPDLARRTRFQDRFLDLYVHVPMQKIVTDNLRPPGMSDAHGVGQAKEQLRTALGLFDKHMAGRQWAIGDAFSMADCAAAAPLFYVNEFMPLGDAHPNVARYFERLKERPSYARVLAEARPYLESFSQLIDGKH